MHDRTRGPARGPHETDVVHHATRARETERARTGAAVLAVSSDVVVLDPVWQLARAERERPLDEGDGPR